MKPPKKGKKKHKKEKNRISRVDWALDEAHTHKLRKAIWTHSAGNELIKFQSSLLFFFSFLPSRSNQDQLDPSVQCRSKGARAELTHVMKWETETDAKARCLTGLQFWVLGERAGGRACFVTGQKRKREKGRVMGCARIDGAGSLGSQDWIAKESHKPQQHRNGCIPSSFRAFP